jgi:hypothetical protein
MKMDFIKEEIENEDVPGFLESLSGWETVVFELEDDPPVILTLSEAKGKELK